MTGMDVRDAAASGDRLGTLRALRDRLADEIDVCDSPRDLAPLTRELSRVMAEIDALAPPEPKGTPLDEVTKRRAARGANAPGSGRAAG